MAGLVLLPAKLYAAGSPTDTINWGKLAMGLMGGLALFLYGMEMMSDGLKKSAGNKMRAILGALTNNRVIGMMVGAFVTMVIQSSSATTVMLVSFVQAQLMTFAQSLGVILGADIGTTITAQMVAFKLTDYALLMVAIGFCIKMLAREQHLKHIGEAVLGFGILFFGMKLMSDTMKPLRTYVEFINMLKGLENPVLGIFIGAGFTALIQSSSAFSGIVIVLAQQQLISLDAGIPLIMGANIGTCITAGLASIGTSRDAKRVAIAHVLFKIAGVLLVIGWIPTFSRAIAELGARFDSGTARQIANAHTIFNVGLALVFLPFTTVFARFIMYIFPDRKGEKGVVPTTWHLDESVISTPAIALDLARSEMSRMAKILNRMLEAMMSPFDGSGSNKDAVYPQLSLVEGIEMREGKIDFLEERLVEYLLKIGRQSISDQQANEVYSLLSVVSDMESIGDTIQKNIIPLIAKKRALEADFSDEGKRELHSFHEKVTNQIKRLQKAFLELDPEKAQDIMGKVESYLDLESAYRLQHLQRVREGNQESLKTHEVHMELMDLFRRINIYAGNIAKSLAGSLQMPIISGEKAANREEVLVT